jgi:hypothetical protein
MYFSIGLPHFSKFLKINLFLKMDRSNVKIGGGGALKKHF